MGRPRKYADNAAKQRAYRERQGKALRNDQTALRNAPLVLVPKRYGAIYLDPPWAFRVWDKDTGQGRSAELHYPTMSIDDLCALPVPDLMAKDCAVFMWATWPMLPDAMILGAAWGLEYKTCAFLWAKLTKRTQGRFVHLSDPANWFTGMGYWSRANTEPCLLFTKGSPKRLAKDVRQIIATPIGRHSAKPDETYGRIQRLVGGPYLEMFARQTWGKGWDCWGNEVDSTIQLERQVI